MRRLANPPQEDLVMMASQTSPVVAPAPEAVDLARQRIERLVRERLAGRRVDGVTFVEELLALATLVGEVQCSPVADRGLRFQLAGAEPFEVELDANRGKLRSLCARLAVLSRRSTRTPPSFTVAKAPFAERLRQRGAEVKATRSTITWPGRYAG